MAQIVRIWNRLPVHGLTKMSSGQKFIAMHICWIFGSLVHWVSEKIVVKALGLKNQVLVLVKWALIGIGRLRRPRRKLLINRQLETLPIVRSVTTKKLVDFTSIEFTSIQV